MPKGWLVPLAVAIGVIGPLAADACGDKLAVLGGGVRFERVHSSRYPGSIILYLNSGSQPHNADELRLALERVGHKVRSVHDRAELDLALQETKPDLVLMDWADAQELMAHAGNGSGSAPAVLGVVYDSGSDKSIAAAGQRSCVADAGKRKGIYVVKSVESLLERRHKGQPLQCD